MENGKTLGRKEPEPTEDAMEEDRPEPADDAMEVDEDAAVGEHQSESASSESEEEEEESARESPDSSEDSEPEVEPKQPARKVGRRPQRLPRNVPSLREIQALQNSSMTQLRMRTTQRMIRSIVRGEMNRSDVKFTAGSYEEIKRVLEMLLYEKALQYGQACLRGGRATLMDRHVRSELHREEVPNMTLWNEDDYRLEESLLEPSRFRNSRLHREDTNAPA